MEWQSLKLLVCDSQYPCDSFEKLWQLIAQYHRPAFPNLIKLAKIALVFPIHTVDCERGFSAQNIIKTSLRSRLSSDHLQNIMFIKCGPSYKNFEFNKALVKFKAKKSRKIFSSPT